MHPLTGVAELGPPGDVVAEGFVGLLDAHGHFARPTRALVGAGEVADERLLEVHPGVDTAGREAIKPRSGRAGEHEWHIANRYALVAPGDAYGRGVIDQLVFWLGHAVVFQRIPRQGEASGERLPSDPGSEASRTDGSVFL